MVAGLHHRPVAEHKNPVGADHAGQPVRQDQRGAPHHQPVQRLLDDRLVLGIDRGQRLIQHQHRRIPQQRPGDRQTLPLSAGQAGATLADHRLIAVGQGADEAMRIGRGRGGDDLGVRRLRPAEPQVFLDRAVEQVSVLRDDGDHAAHLRRIERPADRGRRCGSRRPAPDAAATAAGRWSICRSRWGRRSRPARRRRSGTSGRYAPPAARRGRRTRHFRTRSPAVRAGTGEPEGAATGVSSSALMPVAAACPFIPWCSTPRRSRSGRKISVPAISTISSASRLISPWRTRQAPSASAAAEPNAVPRSVNPRVSTFSASTQNVLSDSARAFAASMRP